MILPALMFGGWIAVAVVGGILSLAGSEDADVRTMDLAGCAERYLLDGGMSAEQIELLRERLTGG